MYRSEPYSRDRPPTGRYDDGYSSFHSRGGGAGRGGGWDDGRYRDDVARLEAERKQRERPTRTLFIRNIKYDVTEPEIRTAFERFGDIKSFFNLTSKRGLCFITYYDQRAADNARKEMQGFELAGRSIDVHYSLPKDEDGSDGPRDPNDTDEDLHNNGTIFLQIHNPSAPVSTAEVKDFFAQFGDIKAVRDHKTDPNSKFIEFHDTRASKEAVAKTDGTEFKGGQLKVRFAFGTKKDNPARPPGGRLTDSPPRYGGYSSSGRYGRDEYVPESSQSRYGGSYGSGRSTGGYDNYRDSRSSSDSYSRHDPSDRDSYSSRNGPVPSYNPLQSHPLGNLMQLQQQQQPQPPSAALAMPPSATSIMQAGLNLQALLGNLQGQPPGLQQPPMRQPSYPPQGPPLNQHMQGQPQYYLPPQNYNQPPPVDSQATVLNQMTQLAEYLKGNQQRGQQQPPPSHGMMQPPPGSYPPMNGMMPPPQHQMHMGLHPQGPPPPMGPPSAGGNPGMYPPPHHQPYYG